MSTTTDIIAFPGSYFRGKNLNGIRTYRLRVGSDNSILTGVRLADLVKVCGIIGINKGDVTCARTDFTGVYLAKIKQGAKARINKKTPSRKPAPDKKNARAVLREKYMHLCDVSRETKTKKVLESKIKRLTTIVERTQRDLVTALRGLEAAQQQLQSTEGPKESALARYGEEFDKLLAHPDIVRVEINNGINNSTITVFTKTIFIDFDRRCYEIGKFKITIPSNGSSVRMINLTRTVNSKAYYEKVHHPHVNPGGVPCLGNIQETIPHLIAEHKYAAAASICIQYLKTFTDDGSRGHYAVIDQYPQKTRSNKHENG